MMRERALVRLGGAAIVASTAALSSQACWSPYSEEAALSHDDASADDGHPSDADVLTPVDGDTPGDGGADAPEDADAQPAAEAYAAAVLSDGPLAYWRFSEPMSTVAVDHSGNQHDATYVGGCQPGVPGPFPGSKAVRLDRNEPSRCEIRATGIDFDGTTPFTLEIWAKPSAVSSQYWRLFGHGINNVQGYQHFGVYFRDPMGIVFERTVNDEIIVASVPSPPLGDFVHVAAVYDGTQLVLSVNGGVAAAKVLDARSQIAKASPFWIGSNGNENFFDGVLAEAAVYAKALSAQQIATHYAIAKEK